VSVDFGEFLALTVSGLIVQLAGVVLTVWLSHRKLKQNLDRRTTQQDGTIAALTVAQTEHFQQMTDQQTDTLLGRRWFRRSKKRGPT
jgi:hypothetical protein